MRSLPMIRYIDLLDKLCRLIEDGLGDSREADLLRDEMDVHWEKMSAEEVFEVNRMGSLKVRPFVMWREEFFTKPSFALGMSIWRSVPKHGGWRWSFGIHLIVASIGVALEGP